MFQFPGSFPLRVSRLQREGFPHSDTCGYIGRLHLPAAFRSLPRPSSSLGAKASPMRPYFASFSFGAPHHSAGHLPAPSRRRPSYFLVPFLSRPVNELFPGLNRNRQRCAIKWSPPKSAPGQCDPVCCHRRDRTGIARARLPPATLWLSLNNAPAPSDSGTKPVENKGFEPLTPSLQS